MKLSDLRKFIAETAYLDEDTEIVVYGVDHTFDHTSGLQRSEALKFRSPRMGATLHQWYEGEHETFGFKSKAEMLENASIVKVLVLS